MKVSDVEEYRDEERPLNRDWDDIRAPVLSLKHLNKLRKVRELRTLELKNEKEQLEKIYGEADQEESHGF